MININKNKQITVKFKGGLGNQLFQWALLLKLKEIFTNGIFFIDITHYEHDKNHNGFELDPVLIEKRISHTNWDTITEKNYNDTLLHSSDKLLFDGYWQDEFFLPKNLSPIISYVLKAQNNRKIKKIAKDIIKTNSIAVHIRRGDYIKNQSLGYITSIHYFNNAISVILNNCHNPFFFVFSDDIAWCKANINLKDHHVRYIDNRKMKKSYFDLFLMSQCKHHILSNSSYSWWANRLNPNRLNGIFITPPFWSHHKSFENRTYFTPNSITCNNIPILQNNQKDSIATFIVTTYDNTLLSNLTISSLLTQNESNIEVVVMVNSCTVDIEKSLLADSRLHIVCEKDISINQIIEEANSQYIMIIENGNWVEPEIIAQSIHSFPNHDIIKPGIFVLENCTNIINLYNKYLNLDYTCIHNIFIKKHVIFNFINTHSLNSRVLFNINIQKTFKDFSSSYTTHNIFNIYVNLLTYSNILLNRNYCYTFFNTLFINIINYPFLLHSFFDFTIKQILTAKNDTLFLETVINLLNNNSHLVLFIDYLSNKYKEQQSILDYHLPKIKLINKIENNKLFPLIRILLKYFFHK